MFTKRSISISFPNGRHHIITFPSSFPSHHLTHDPAEAPQAPHTLLARRTLTRSRSQPESVSPRTDKVKRVLLVCCTLVVGRAVLQPVQLRRGRVEISVKDTVQYCVPLCYALAATQRTHT